MAENEAPRPLKPLDEVYGSPVTPDETRRFIEEFGPKLRELQKLGAADVAPGAATPTPRTPATGSADKGHGIA